MIAHFSYVICDNSGTPGYVCDVSELADDAREARQWARRAGWTRKGGRDLCPKCSKGRDR